jgi:hypothetical protein
VSSCHVQVRRYRKQIGVVDRAAGREAVSTARLRLSAQPLTFEAKSAEIHVDRDGA